MELGIIAGGDMVPEAALTKLCYVLSKPGLTQQARLQVICATYCLNQG